MYMKEFYHQIGKRVHLVRNYKGYSKEELSNKTKLSYTCLSEIEDGKNRITVDVLYILSRALDISMDYLVTGSFQIGENQTSLKNKSEIMDSDILFFSLFKEMFTEMNEFCKWKINKD